MGHTAVVHAKDDARIREFATRMPAMRVLVNTPAPQGSTGITTNVFPSMTLGCGAVAGNITSDNVGPLHLINIKRLAYVVRQPQEAFEMPLTNTMPAPARVAAPDVVDAKPWLPPWSVIWPVERPEPRCRRFPLPRRRPPRAAAGRTPARSVVQPQAAPRDGATAPASGAAHPAQDRTSRRSP